MYRLTIQRTTEDRAVKMVSTVEVESLEVLKELRTVPSIKRENNFTNISAIKFKSHNHNGVMSHKMMALNV